MISTLKFRSVAPTLLCSDTAVSVFVQRFLFWGTDIAGKYSSREVSWINFCLVMCVAAEAAVPHDSITK